MSTLWQDVRFGVRTLRRAPAFTLAAVATLALGIGATTAIFSAANAALLRPLPYPRSQDLRTVRTTFTDGNVTSGLLAGVELARLNGPGLPIERAAVGQRFDLTLLRADDAPVTTAVYFVSQRFFDVFGLAHTIGPGFGPEHFVPGGPSGAIISYRLWRDVYGSDPAIVGKTARIAEGDQIIVGVAGRDFDVPKGTDIWLPAPIDPQGVAHGFEGYLRVKPGTSPEHLQTALAQVAQGLGRDYPGPETNRAFLVESYVNAMVGDLRPTLIIVLAATTLLLLLACVNVTNLLLARGAGRMREMSARAAVGATRSRLIRQLLTESAVLAMLGAVAGIAVAYVGTRALLAYGASKLPRLDEVPFDGSVLLFALTTLLISALVVGIAPAFQLARASLEGLRGDGRTVRGSRATHRTLRLLIVGEVAVAITLVAGAGLVLRSFANLQAIQPGFAASGRLVFDLSLPFQRYGDPVRLVTWVQSLLESLGRLDGVAAVGAASGFPLRPDTAATPLVRIEGSDVPPVVSRMRIVTPGFFTAMGIQMRQGRGFTDDDRASTGPVAVVSDSFARRYLAGRDPLRAEIAYGFPAPNPGTRRAVVGVVSDVKYASLDGEPQPSFYVVLAQVPVTVRLSIAVATSAADPATLIPAVRRQVNQADPLLPLEITPVDALVASTLSRQKLGMTLMIVFGVLAVTLAAIGIYGVIAYASSERRGEVATRLALGASASNVFWLLVAQARWLVVAGGAVGLIAAYLGGSLASVWLYRVTPSDPWILGASLAIVLTVTVVTTLIPAARATRVDPAQALRGE